MGLRAPGEDINSDQGQEIAPETIPNPGSGGGSLSGYFGKMEAANDAALSLDHAQDFEQQKDVTALTLSAKANPIQTRDQASKILKLEMDTGLPTEFINDNLAEVEKEAKAGSFDLEHFRQTSPKFAQFVAANPAHLPLFGEDLQKFQDIEAKSSASLGFDQASLLSQKSALIGKRFSGTATPADLKAEADIDAQLQAIGAQKEGESFSQMVSGAVGYTVRQTGDSVGAAATGAAVGAGAGALAAPFTAGASVPALAIAGAKVGALSATAMQSYEMETNFAYDEISKVPGVDNETAKNVARAVGAVNSVIETAGDLFVLRRIPGVDKLFNTVTGSIRKNATQLATKALARETTREALISSAKKVAEIGGEEAAQEFVQSLVGASGKSVAASVSEVDDGQTWNDTVSGAYEEGKQAFWGSIGTFGLLHASTNLYKHIDTVKQGDKNAQMFDAIAGGVQSEAFKSLPDKGQEALKAILAGGGAETTYFQSDAWDAYWKAKGVDPREAAVQVSQDGGASYDQAFDAGGFIAVPTERVGRKLLHNTEHKELLMDATTDVTKATPREAMKAQEDLQKEIEAAKADQANTEVQSTNELEDKMFKALTDARVPGDARTQAKLFSKIAGTFAKSEGKTAEDLVAPYALEISRIMNERVRQQSIDSLDPILEQIRAGALPDESTARGESLVSFLRNKGGINVEGLGGDVAALEPDKALKSYKKLVKKSGGIDFDHAVEQAHESGYIQNRDSREFLDALSKEVAGEPVYSQQFENSNALENIRITQEFAKHLKSLGIDLSKMDNQTVKKMLTENKAQTPDSSEERDDIFLQSNPGTDQSDLGFYSRMIRTIEEKMGTSASIEQVNGMLKEIKPEERKWLGLDEFLNGKTKVNKEDLLQYLRANDLQIKEIVKENTSKMKFVSKSEADDLIEQNVNVYREDGSGPIDETAGFPEDYRFRVVNSGKNETKFEGHTLLGGENYREVLFTLPGKDSGIPNNVKIENLGGGDYGPDQFNFMIDGTPADIKNGKWSESISAPSFRTKDEAIKYAESRESTKGKFESSHFGEKNILAHTRLNDRTDSDGKKVLFIEEVQSDWHQTGRKSGYRDEEALAKAKKSYNDFFESMESKYGISELWFKKATPEERKINNKLFDDIQNLKNKSLVPDAPFKKTWHEFVFKRIIRMAAEQGYDKIGWTTGEQQADRYDLAKQVDNIVAIKQDDGIYNVEAYKDGSAVYSGDNLNESKIQAALGKDLAAKIVADSGEDWPGGGKNYQGDDLKVGGEGMKGFYDKILVDFASKFSKKYGSKVSDISFGKNAMLEGQTAHSLEITPKLKEAALNEGFSLFQNKDKGPLGQLRIGSGRKMNIDLYAKADFSTFAHEQAHFWLEVMGDIAESPEGSERVKQIYADALEYLGVKDRSEIKREHHEKFAESFEKYLMEGKAPTPALQRLFNTFRAWLEFIYSGLRQLDVKISPQIKDVFDRLLATDDEIAAAQKEQSFDKLILDPVAAGLTDEQLEKYSKLHEEAKQEATNTLLVKVMKQMQRERTAAWKDEQAEVKAQVTRAVDERADITLIKMLKAGRLEGRGDMPVKLDRKTLIDAYGKEFVDKLPRGIFGKDGMGHEELAALLGFENGWDMVEMIANTPDRAALIEQTVNDEMVSRHGDEDVYLNGTLQEEALNAIHTDKQAELMRLEYDFLQQQKTKDTKSLVKSIARRAPTVQQVRQKAEEIIAQESVSSLKPYQYLRSEKKHANNAIDFLQKGDIDNALDSKKKELLNHELYRAATLAKENVEKIEGRFNKFFQEDSKLGKNRDMQLIGAGRAILAGYGFGKDPKTPDQHLEQMKKYNPDGYALLIDRVNAALENADFYKNLTYEKFLALNDVVYGIWQQSKSSMLIKIDGQKLLQREAIDTLLLAVSKLPAKASKITESTQSPAEEKSRGFLSKIATLKRVEAKLGVMDEYADGEFKKYLFNSVREATENYRAKKGELIKRFNTIVQAHKDNFGGKEIVASSLNFRFKNKGELLAAMLHTGNESNFKKLILGNGWGELREDKTLDSIKWDAFIEDSQMTGLLTKADYDFLQSIWDLFESFKAESQAAHYEMNGFYFGEIVGKPIKTPWGDYLGGYVPATPDNTRSKESAIRNEKYQIEDNFARELPPKVDGFTKNRVENFSTPLLMDLSAIPFQIDRTLRYTYITPRVKEVMKLVHNRELRAALDEYDPHFVDQILIPFLSRATTQSTTIHTDSKYADQFYSFAKNNAAIQIMFANIPNIVQQAANYIPAALRAGPGFLLNAVKHSVLNNKDFTQVVISKSLFMKNQLERSDEKARFETDKVLSDLNKFETANEWVRANAYIGQIYLQNIMNVQVWMASYDQAQAKGMNEDESVRYADSAVRETQSSLAPEDTAAIETDKPVMKALMMFYGFFNNMANLYASEWSKASTLPGSKAIAKKTMIAANFGLFAFAGQIIVDGLRGKVGEDDDDKESLEFWLKYYFGASFSLVAPMAGIFGQLAQVGFKNLTNSNSYGNRVSVSPVISGTEQIISTVARASSGKDVSDKEKVKGAMSLMGMVPLMGFVPVGAIPGVSPKVSDTVAGFTKLSGSAAVLGALKKPVGYAVGVQEGKDKADSPADVLNGIMSGSAKK